MVVSAELMLHKSLSALTMPPIFIPTDISRLHSHEHATSEAQLTYGPGQVSDAVDVLHLGPDAQRLSWSVHRHIGVYSQLAL